MDLKTIRLPIHANTMYYTFSHDVAAAWAVPFAVSILINIRNHCKQLSAGPGVEHQRQRVWCSLKSFELWLSPTKVDLDVGAMARLRLQPKAFISGFAAGAIIIRVYVFLIGHHCMTIHNLTERYYRASMRGKRENNTGFHHEIRQIRPLLFSDGDSHEGNEFSSQNRVVLALLDSARQCCNYTLSMRRPSPVKLRFYRYVPTFAESLLSILPLVVFFFKMLNLKCWNFVKFENVPNFFNANVYDRAFQTISYTKNHKAKAVRKFLG